MEILRLPVAHRPVTGNVEQTISKPAAATEDVDQAAAKPRPATEDAESRFVKLPWSLHIDVAVIEAAKIVRSIAMISGLCAEEHAVFI
jgi:hypothetical protein